MITMSEGSSAPEAPRVSTESPQTSTPEVPRSSPTEASKSFLVRAGNRLDRSFQRAIIKDPTFSYLTMLMGGITASLGAAQDKPEGIIMGAGMMGFGEVLRRTRKTLTPPNPPKRPRTTMDAIYDLNYPRPIRFIRKKFNIKGP